MVTMTKTTHPAPTRADNIMNNLSQTSDINSQNQTSLGGGGGGGGGGGKDLTIFLIVSLKCVQHRVMVVGMLIKCNWHLW